MDICCLLVHKFFVKCLQKKLQMELHGFSHDEVYIHATDFLKDRLEELLANDPALVRRRQELEEYLFTLSP